MRISLLALLPVTLGGGCYVETQPIPPPPPGSASLEVTYEPPLYQPEPITVDYDPPPPRVEYVGPAPYPGAVWVGGYWHWNRGWQWMRGRWMQPPHPGYVWTP